MSNAGLRSVMRCPVCDVRYDEGVTFCARDGSALVRESSPRQADIIGQVFAERYRIVRLIGEGGMGQVYEAHHVNINKRFALKLLKPEIVSNAEAVARFRQEAWSASSIGHDNIVEIDDFATLPDGSVYLAMELLEGQSLADRLHAKPDIGWDEASDVLTQVCRGLQAAHDKGIIHRDLKPENIFLTRKQQRLVVKILDFGIAKVSNSEGSAHLTRTGAIFGTPHYMAPEQALGSGIDARADVYSLGVIMYEMFCGRVPFDADSFMAILSQHITTPPVPPRQAAPDREISKALEQLILRAIAKEPAQRFATMNELAAAIDSLTRQNAVHTERPGVRPQHTGELHSNAARVRSVNGRATRWMIGIALVAIATLGLLLRSRGRAPLEQPGQAAVEPRMATTSRSDAPSWPSAAKAPSPSSPARAASAQPQRVEVILDSTPSGAAILRKGEPPADTPEAIDVAVGSTVSLLLRKPGFRDAAVIVDPAKGRKLLVPLEPLHRPPARVREIRSAPSEPAVPTKAGPPSPAPDPYERLDEHPTKKPELLNPY